MKKKLYISWYCASCKKSGIAEVELPTQPKYIQNSIWHQHYKELCKAKPEMVEIRNVEVAVK